MNARQKRLFEEARKRNPNLQIPTEQHDTSDLTEQDLALLKQGVGDKSTRGPGMTASPSEGGGEGPYVSVEQAGTIVKYFDDKGFGFIRPDGGGKDVFFHVSRLVEGLSTDLVPSAKVSYETEMDRTGRMAATSLRILPAE